MANDGEQVSNNTSTSLDLEVKKRLRCINFTSQEKNILIHIIEKYPDIVECKKTDKISVQQREAVWEDVTREFNDIFLNETVRTTRQLRMCYDNLKKRLRKEKNAGEVKIVKTDVNGVLQSHVTDSLSDDSTSSTRLNGANSTFQDSIVHEITHHYDPKPDPYIVTVCNNRGSEDISSEPPKKRPSIAKLRRKLLNKQIKCIELDIEMKAKKYELELKVEQAKLEYYKQKRALIGVQNAVICNIPNGKS